MRRENSSIRNRIDDEYELTIQCPVCLTIETLTFNGCTIEHTKHWKQVSRQIHHRDCGRPCYVIDANRSTEIHESPMDSFLWTILKKHRCLPTQLAFSIGVSPSSVSRWLNGKSTPSLRSCQKLAEYSGLAIADIVAISNNHNGGHK